MPLPIVGFRDMYELKTLRQGRAKPNLMRDSVMSKAPEPEWQPEYQKEPPLEAPMFSPDDLIGAGVIKAATLPLMGLAGMTKRVGKSLSDVVARGAKVAVGQDGPSSMLLAGGRGLSKSPGTVPHGVDMPGFHWSHETSLSQTNPAFYGRGIKGAEKGRLAGQGDIRDRTYFYNNDVAREAGLGSNHYRGDLKNVYPESNPLNLPTGDANAYERAIKGAGFDGYENRGMVAYFKPVPVAKHQTGTVAPAPRSAAHEITDTTETVFGTRLNPSPELSANGYQNDRMKWLQASDRLAYGPGSTREIATGQYMNPAGVLETNPVMATSVPYSAENEAKMGLWNHLKGIMLGQNAAAYSGVKPGASDALRIHTGGATSDALSRVANDLDAAGAVGAPFGSGINALAGGSGKSADELYQLVQGSANRAGIPKAEVMPGSAVGNYRDLKWGDVPGTGVLTRDLVQELERNAAATRALDATGAPQQLARGVQAAGRSFADRTASPIDSAAAVGRSDIDKFLSVLQKGGLRGLLDRTRPVEQGGLGYAGLPAAGGLYLAPNNDDRPLWERLYSR